MSSPERLVALERSWQRLVAPFAAPAEQLYGPFDRLAAAYQEPHRHYHTLEHVSEVLRVAARLVPQGADPAAVLLAAWFHDAVYDPTRDGNEAASAELARQLLPTVGVPAGTIGEVARLILLTDYRTPVGDADAAGVALVDADLAILGSAETRYARYAEGIRAEYSHVPDADYRAGRVVVLRGFLARETIYRHPLMLAEGEERARANLADEVRGLEG